MARTEPAATHGWFPDPEGSGQLRMWDGHAWTRLTKYPSAGDVIGSAPPPASAPLPAAAPRADPAPSERSRPRPGFVRPAFEKPTEEPAEDDRTELARFGHANRYSLATIAVAIVYMIVAAATGFVLVGILPVGLGIRAYQVREPSAPVAVLAAASVVVVALMLRT